MGITGMKYDFASPCSSPTTPSSPLPVSVDVGQEGYNISASSDSDPPSPPFSPHFSSPEASPLFRQSRWFNRSRRSAMMLDWDNFRQTSAFSLHQELREDVHHKKNSCFKNLIEWLFLKCCNCCSRLTTRRSKPKE